MTLMGRSSRWEPDSAAALVWTVNAKCVPWDSSGGDFAPGPLYEAGTEDPGLARPRRYPYAGLPTK